MNQKNDQILKIKNINVYNRAGAMLHNLGSED